MRLSRARFLDEVHFSHDREQRRDRWVQPRRDRGTERGEAQSITYVGLPARTKLAVAADLAEEHRPAAGQLNALDQPEGCSNSQTPCGREGGKMTTCETCGNDYD